LKKLYFDEYYRIHVGLSAEDRERIHFWSLHPLWTKDIALVFANEFPLKWANYNFFTKLMKKVDPRLLNTPIYARDINLKSLINRLRYDLKLNYATRYKRETVHFLTKRTYGLYEVIRKILRRKSIQEKAIHNFQDRIDLLYQKLKYTRHLFNEKSIFYDEKENIRLSTMLIFFAELEERYPEKFQ
jgi:hypothetical protein